MIVNDNGQYCTVWGGVAIFACLLSLTFKYSETVLRVSMLSLNIFLLIIPMMMVRMNDDGSGDDEEYSTGIQCRE